MYVKAFAEAQNLMKTRKAAGQSDVTTELLKVCKNESVKKLAEVADNLLQRKELHKKWRSNLTPTHKEKGDVRSWGNYRSVKFWKYGVKVNTGGLRTTTVSTYAVSKLRTHPIKM